MFGGRERRRQKLRERPFPQAWGEVLERAVPLVRRLPTADRAKLEGLIQVFVAEKRFEGAAGFEVTDEVRVVIAAHACLLVLRQGADIYPRLLSIIVYPGEFVARVEEHDDQGFVWEDEESRAGESWTLGSLVLSWDDVLADREDPDGEWNVILHEFAHQLDAENGEMNGLPTLREAGLRRTWTDTMADAYDDLVRQVDAGRTTALDPYAAEDPSEFFAVATELFFQQPRRLHAVYPKVYEVLARYYAQDPLAWAKNAAVVRSAERSRDES